MRHHLSAGTYVNCSDCLCQTVCPDYFLFFAVLLQPKYGERFLGRSLAIWELLHGAEPVSNIIGTK